MKLVLLFCLLAQFARAQTILDSGCPKPFGGCNAVVLTAAPKDVHTLVAKTLADQSYIVIGNRDRCSITAMGSTQQPAQTLSITLSLFMGDSTVFLAGTYLPPVGHAGRLAPLINRGEKTSYNIEAWTEVERLVGVLAQALQATKVRYLISENDF